MSVLDSLDDLATDTLTVQRSQGSYVAGVYVPGTPSTFTIVAVVQPAYNMNRVIGGTDLRSKLEGISTTNVRQVHTRTQALLTQTPTNDPDVIIGYEGSNWTVARSEEWVSDSGEKHYHCLITRQTGGGP